DGSTGPPTLRCVDLRPRREAGRSGRCCCRSARQGRRMKPATEAVDSARQKAHYEGIHDRYEAHYYDGPSLDYRERFILAPLLKDLDLNDRDVLDLASGSGHNTMLLRRRFPRMRALGIDISESACQAYRSMTGFPAVQGDFTRPLALGRQFDAVLIVGGLHHLVANLPQAI